LRSQLKEKPPGNQLERATSDALVFGCELRTQRLKLGWSASQLSECYAEFVGREDSPPGPTFIYHLERGTTGIGMARRVILASLVGLPLAGLHDSPTATTLDVSEYTQALEGYCGKLRAGTIQEEEGAIQERTHRLEAVSWSARGQEQKTLIELLGFYQILHADIFTWGGYTERAYTILSATVERARQEKLAHLFTHALTERAGTVRGLFEMTRDQISIQTAIDDYKEALQERDKLSPLYCGLLDIGRGLADAYLARDNEEWTLALSLMRLGSNQIGFSPDDVRIIARLDSEHYLLNRASAYLYSPMGKPALALSVLKELDDWCPEARGKGRLVQRNRLFAEAYLATGDYPMAAAYLEAALESASRGEINRLIEIHARLKKTSYWNDPELGRIAVKINQVKYPDLFS
jgi:hypothetical protein